MYLSSHLLQVFVILEFSVSFLWISRKPTEVHHLNSEVSETSIEMYSSNKLKLPTQHYYT